MDSKFTNNLENLLDVDCVFIVCPTNRHFFYLDYLYRNNYKGYIFCEKLPVSNLKEILKLKRKINSKIYFNFNLQHSYLIKLIKEKKYGNLRNFVIFDNKPFFLEKLDKKQNWRFKDKNILITNILPHYLHLIRKNFPKLEKKLSLKLLKKDNRVQYLNVNCKSKSTIFNIHLSYMQGLEKFYVFYFDRAKIEVFKKELRIFNLNESAKKKRRFQHIKTTKKIKIKDIFNDSNKSSVNYFLRKCKRNKKFSISDTLFDLNINKEIISLKK